MSVYRKLAASGVLVVGLVLPFGTGVASAKDTCKVGDDYCTPEEPPAVVDSDAEVLPEETVAVPAQVEVPETPSEAPSEAPSGTLPFTGGDVVGMTIIGAGAIAVGTVMVKRAKRSSVEAA